MHVKYNILIVIVIVIVISISSIVSFLLFLNCTKHIEVIKHNFTLTRCDITLIIEIFP